MGTTEDGAQGTIEADWLLNDACNLKCLYCFGSGTAKPARAGRRRVDPARYLDFFNATGKIWRLHLTGGEPFLYPGFVELCNVLSRGHLLSLNSNLSSARVRDFAETVDPSRVEYLHCSLHLQERDRLGSWQMLENNLSALVSRNFRVFASQVMTPESFAAFPAAAERLAELGVALLPKALRGLFEGKWYPHSYSEREKALFCTLSEEAEANVTPALNRQIVTVNPLRDREFLNGFPLFRGTPCGAGTQFVTIYSNGDIFRCGRSHLLGNIERGRFTPLRPGTPCDSSYCPYFCLRYSEKLKSASGAAPILLQTPPPVYLQTISGLLRKGKKALKQRLR